jgi:hypothetical protein
MAAATRTGHKSASSLRFHPCSLGSALDAPWRDPIPFEDKRKSRGLEAWPVLRHISVVWRLRPRHVAVGELWYIYVVKG